MKCPTLPQRLISMSSDGASSNVGKDKGAIKRIEERVGQVCKAGTFRTWCGLHRLDLLVKELLHDIDDENFINSIINIQNYLRRRATFWKLHGKCPTFSETRWISLHQVITWLQRKRTIVIDYLKNNNVQWRPSAAFWVMMGVVDEFMEAVELVFQGLQGRNITVADQEKRLKDLQIELAEIVGATRVVESTQTQPNDEEEPGYANQRTGDWEINRQDAELVVLSLSNWIKVNY